MTTVLLIGMVVWIGGLEWRLWINIRRLNEFLDAQQMNSLKGFRHRHPPNASPGRPEFGTETVAGNNVGSLASGADSALTNA